MPSDGRTYVVTVDGQELEVALERRGDRWAVRIDGGEALEADFGTRGPAGQYSLLLKHRSYEGIVQPNGNGLKVWVEGDPFDVKAVDARLRALAGSPAAGAAARIAVFRTPMPGMVVGVLVEPGQEVRKGQPLITLEAMKMRNDLKSPEEGRVKAVAVRTGQTLAKGDVLVEFEM